jgi:hypothetical protein
VNKKELHKRAYQVAAAARNELDNTYNTTPFVEFVANAYEKGYRQARMDLRKLLEIRNGRSSQPIGIFAGNVRRWLKNIR